MHKLRKNNTPKTRKMNYDDPSDLTSLEKQIEEKKESGSQRTLKNVDPRIIGLAGIGALFLFYLYYTGKADIKLLAGMLVGLIAVVFLMAQTQTKTKPYLTFEECSFYLNKHLAFMKARKWGDLTQIDPETEYKILPITRERWIDAKPWKRAIGVTLKEPSGLKHWYIAEVHLITGDLISMIKCFGEWDGRGLDDVRTTWRPSEDLTMTRRAQQYLRIDPRKKEAI